MRSLWWAACLCVGLSACGQLPLDSRDRLPMLLLRQGFEPVQVEPTLKAWLRTDPAITAAPASGHSERFVLPHRTLRVYIEGDGAAWWSQRLPPSDPTPSSSVAVQLAASDRHAQVAYLARPCQFLSVEERQTCPVEWWTSARYGPHTLAQSQRLLDELLRISGARSLELIGHSGGGTLAVLLAAERTDVSCLVTLAAPLDIDAWTAHHQVTRLHGSRNPAQLPAGQPSTAAIYLFGERDAVVPVSTLGRFARRLSPGQVTVMPGWGHTEGWNQPRSWQPRVGCLGDS